MRGPQWLWDFNCNTERPIWREPQHIEALIWTDTSSPNRRSSATTCGIVFGDRGADHATRTRLASDGDSVAVCFVRVADDPLGIRKHTTKISPQGSNRGRFRRHPVEKTCDAQGRPPQLTAELRWVGVYSWLASNWRSDTRSPASACGLSRINASWPRASVGHAIASKREESI